MLKYHTKLHKFKVLNLLRVNFEFFVLVVFLSTHYTRNNPVIDLLL